MDFKQILECYWEKFHTTDCDFTVIVENRRFSCHRFVLSACSGFFEGLLRSDMVENRQSEATLEGMNSEVFASILDVLYKGSDVLTKENMVMMWQAAHQLQIMFLIGACENFIIKHLSRDNVFDIHSTALLIESERVLRSARKTLADNNTAVSKTEMFLSLPHLEILKMLQVAKDDSRHWPFGHCRSRRGETETDGFVLSVVYWVFGKLGEEQKTVGVQINTKERKPYLKTLLEAAGIDEGSNQCLLQVMRNDDVMKCKNAREVAITAIELKLCGKKKVSSRLSYYD